MFQLGCSLLVKSGQKICLNYAGSLSLKLLLFSSVHICLLVAGKFLLNITFIWDTSFIALNFIHLCSGQLRMSTFSFWSVQSIVNCYPPNWYFEAVKSGHRCIIIYHKPLGKFIWVSVSEVFVIFSYSPNMKCSKTPWHSAKFNAIGSYQEKICC